MIVLLAIMELLIPGIQVVYLSQVFEHIVIVRVSGQYTITEHRFD